MPDDVQVRADPLGVERILRSLPEWFGIEEAIQNYVAMASRLESHLAVRDGRTVGVALVERHFPESAELALIAVQDEHRSSGLGRLLIASVEESLRRNGCDFLEVHTVGPSYEDPGYDATRAFYRALGFARIHEYMKLDWDGPTLVLIKPLA